ncbi:MAG TPA: C39 family peptidase [Acholeplasmataceae bacterium]|nr:C39 family peptidase [Acholeplasmataceae bacterium]
MKKLFIIMFSLLAIVLWGCTPSEVEVGVLKDYELPEFIYEDVSFPTQFTDVDNVTYQLSYFSSKPDILNVSGKIGEITKNEEVSITVEAKSGKKEYQKEFVILVLKTPLEEGVLKDLEIPNVISEDYGFILNITDNQNQEYNLKYSSSDVEAISNSGKVNRDDTDKNVTITVIAERENQFFKKEYNVLIPASSTEENDDVLTAKEAFDLGIEIVENDVELALVFMGFELTWVSSNSSVIDKTGKYYPGDQDTNVTLTAEFRKENEVLATKDFIVLAKGLSTQERFLMASSDVDLPVSISVGNDLDLIDSFQHGVTGVWESNKPEIVSSDGKVVFATTKETVILTLTLSYLNEEFKINYTVTINSIENSLEFMEAIGEINIPSKTKVDISLPSLVEVNGKTIELEYFISNTDVIGYDGVINRDSTDKNVIITITRKTDDRVEQIEKTVTVLKLGVEDAFDLFELGITETYSDIELPESFMGYEIIWLSFSENIISSTGKYSFVSEDTEVLLSALLLSGDYPEKEFTVIAKPIPDLERLNLIVETINIPEVATSNLVLKTMFDYDVTGIWTSSNEDVITTSGTVYLSDSEKVVTLTVNLQYGDSTLTKVFTVTTIAIEGKQVMGHNYQDYAKDYNLANMIDVHLENKRLVLDEGKTSGTYVSSEFNTKGFGTLVASWAAISSKTATAEIEVKVKVDGVWSKYFSYQKWGLGLQNRSINSSDSIAKLSTDELVVGNSKTANAYQYRVTLRRNTIADESPKLLLVAVALTIPGYTFEVDQTGFPDFVDYDVPKLNQNEVPTIGNSICSITSSTMLLKYKGHDFTEFDSEYEHRYMAGLLKDYGSGIYGNWVYNTVGMSAYGEETYVNKMYSFAELQKHLIEVGPISASMKGNMGLYTTNGHLIVVRGYRVVNGQTHVIINDPNINSRFGEGLFVYYELPLATFMAAWRGVNYIIK